MIIPPASASEMVLGEPLQRADEETEYTETKLQRIRDCHDETLQLLDQMNHLFLRVAKVAYK